MLLRPHWRDCIALGIVALAAACSPTAPVPDLAAVDAPPDLERLDRAVRRQYDEIRGELDRAETANGSREERGAAWGHLGRWFDVYGYGDSAGRCYVNAGRLSPGEPRWPYHLGVLAEESGDLDAAESSFRAAAELAPREAAPRVRLADLAQRRQDLDAAESLYREVLEDHPASPGALHGLAQAAFLRGDPHAALEPLEVLATLQPEAVEVQYSLGMLWRRLGDENRAAEHLARIPKDNLEHIPLMRDDPWDLELHRLDRGSRTLTRRGARAFRRGDPVAAAVLFGQAVAADPEGPEKRINYALALREIGRWRAAHDQLVTALELAAPGSELAAKSHLELGRLLAARGQIDGAMSHLQKALAANPGSVAAHVEIGRLLHLRGDIDAALNHYQTGVSLDPAFVDGRFWRCALLATLGRHAEALKALSSDLEDVGANRSLLLLRARLLAAASDPGLRNVAAARDMLSRASNGSPDVALAETAAMVAAESGAFDDAVRWQRAAVTALHTARPRSAAHIARRRLALYQRHEPCRTPWEEREALLTLPVTVH